MATSRKKNNRILYIGIFIIGLVIFVMAMQAFQKVYETETYFVLNTDVTARQEIHPDMLSPVVTSKGTAPHHLDQAFVQEGGIYAEYPLEAGDILTFTNTTPGLDDSYVTDGVPDSWVITNFAVGADDAVGGRITRGKYFDMLVVDGESAFYPFINVLVLDTTVNLSGASSADAVNQAEAQSGQTRQYVVGMSPENAAKLHTIVERYGSGIKLVMSPKQNNYEKPDLTRYEGSFEGRFLYNIDEDGSIWLGDPSNESGNLINGELTDRTFKPLERDSITGEILEDFEGVCAVGNDRILVDCSTGDVLTEEQLEELAAAEAEAKEALEREESQE